MSDEVPTPQTPPSRFEMPEGAPPAPEFTPNIYPVMYWALAFGLVSGMVLLLMALLSRFITIVWFPIFLAGLAWGGYRNYRKQKQEWYSGRGITPVADTPINEFKHAVRDISEASRNLMTQEEMPEQAQPQEAPMAEEDQAQPPVPPAA